MYAEYLCMFISITKACHHVSYYTFVFIICFNVFALFTLQNISFQ